jgi:hypothetical protein
MDSNCYSASTLTQSLGLVVRHLRWVPQSLTATEKAKRLTLSKKLLRQLHSIDDRGWQFTITLDESWFWLFPDREHVWLCFEE